MFVDLAQSYELRVGDFIYSTTRVSVADSVCLQNNLNTNT